MPIGARPRPTPATNGGRSPRRRLARPSCRVARSSDSAVMIVFSIVASAIVGAGSVGDDAGHDTRRPYARNCVTPLHPCVSVVVHGADAIAFGIQEKDQRADADDDEGFGDDPAAVRLDLTGDGIDGLD